MEVKLGVWKRGERKEENVMSGIFLYKFIFMRHLT